jgi:hypothetical protein
MKRRSTPGYFLVDRMPIRRFRSVPFGSVRSFVRFVRHGYENVKQKRFVVVVSTPPLRVESLYLADDVHTNELEKSNPNQKCSLKRLKSK